MIDQQLLDPGRRHLDDLFRQGQDHQPGAGTLLASPDLYVGNYSLKVTVPVDQGDAYAGLVLAHDGGKHEDQSHRHAGGGELLNTMGGLSNSR